MVPVWPTHDVFGMSARQDGPSYVDRGALDAKLEYWLHAKRHVVIHGDSKQGKTWLRERKLSSDRTLFVQCLHDSTVQSIFSEALGQLGVELLTKSTNSNTLGGELDLTMAGEVGTAVIAKARAEGKIRGKSDNQSSFEATPVGRTPADLSWVSATLQESKKFVVLEDFHYLAEEVQQAFSHIMKALLGYGVALVVTGVWTEPNLLTYFNGDLNGRVENIHLAWSDSELREVIGLGTGALRVTFGADIVEGIVSDAFGNVGILQRVAEQLCLLSQVYETKRAIFNIEGASILDSARRAVASSMSGRFFNFADNFSRGLQRSKEGGTPYRLILEAFLSADDRSLLKGLTVDEIVTRLQGLGYDLPRSSLRGALNRIGQLQAKMKITPIVLVYDRTQKRLILVDRSLLFYRKYTADPWPWEEIDEELSTPADSSHDLRQD